MNRILVIGCPGAGKTTLSRALGERLKLPVVHLDTLYWRDNWHHVSREEFDRLLREALDKPLWILDGNYDRTLEIRLEHCDSVVFLDYPRIVCLWGAVRRILRNYGKSRPDMGGCCRERLDFSFFRYIWNYRQDNRERILPLLAQTRVPVCTLHSRRETRRFLAEVSAQRSCIRYP